MIITIAWIEEDYRVISDVGYDLGRSQKTEKFLVPKALCWVLEGNEEDMKSAQKFIDNSGILTEKIFTYPRNEPDPLKRAKEDIMKEIKV